MIQGKLELLLIVMMMINPVLSQEVYKTKHKKVTAQKPIYHPSHYY